MLALSVTPILVLLLALSSSSAARHVDFLGRSNAAACETVTSTALVTIKLCDPATTTITSIQTVAAIPATVTVTVTGTPASGTWPVVKVTSTLSTASAATASCLSNAQATSIVEAFKTILTDPDRSVVNATAQALIADEFMETSDSINSLAGLPLGNTTFSGKNAFIDAVLNTPPIPQMTTLDIFHDCNRIAFYWAAAAGVTGTQQQQEVRGVDLLYLTNDATKVNMVMVEFNGLAWAKDVGWTLTRPDGTVY